MNVLILLIPIALAIGIAFVVAFIWATSSGQYDDLETPPVRILLDDTETDSQKSN